MASLARHGDGGQVATTVSDVSAAVDADGADIGSEGTAAAAKVVAGTDASARTMCGGDAAATNSSARPADPLIVELVQFAHELADVSQAVILPVFR